MSDCGVRIEKYGDSVKSLDGSYRYLILDDHDLVVSFIESFDWPEREDVSVTASELRDFAASESDYFQNDDYALSELVKLSEYLTNFMSDRFWLYAWW